MRIINISILTAAIVFASSSFADKGNFIVKARGGYLNSSSDISNGSNGTAKGAQKIGSGPTAELALGYFFTDNFAAEISAGYAAIKYTGLDEQRKTLNKVPLTAMAQFYLPIYNKIFPYVGAGYSYGFMVNEPRGVTIANGGNFAVQVGSDIFVDYDRTVALNIDAKFIPKTKHDITKNKEKFATKVSSFTIMAGISALF